MKVRVTFVRERNNEKQEEVRLLFDSIEEYGEWARNIHYYNMVSLKVETFCY